MKGQRGRKTDFGVGHRNGEHKRAELIDQRLHFPSVFFGRVVIESVFHHLQNPRYVRVKKVVEGFGDRL